MNQAIRYATLAAGGFIAGFATLWGIQARKTWQEIDGTTHEPYVFSLTPSKRPESVAPDQWLEIVERAEHRAKKRLAVDFRQKGHVDLMIAPRSSGIDVIVFAGDTDRSLKNAITSAIAGALLVEEYQATNGAVPRDK